MFPTISDGVFDDPSIFFDQDKFLEDLLVDFATSEGNDHAVDSVKKRPRRKASSSSTKEVEENKNGEESEWKKSSHRFTEKQRRQEMAALYASLRSLLPLQYIKGKRAVSDHMQQAVSYIDDTKKKIEEMKAKRDRLRKPRNLAASAIEAQNRSSNYFLKINLFKDAFEVLITSNEGSNSPLSMVLEDLIARKLNIVHCISTRMGHGCYLHKIHIELNNCARIDLAELQERLVDVLKFV